MLVFGLHCHCLYACLSSVLERGCLDGRRSPSAALCYSWCLVAGERKISRRVGELKSGIKQYVDGLGCVVNVAHVTPTLPTDEPRWPSPASGLRQSRIAPQRPHGKQSTVLTCTNISLHGFVVQVGV